MNKNITYKELLKEKDFMKLVYSSTISRFGDSIDAIAYSWIMYQVTGNASLIALILAMNYLPSIFLQPLFGVLVERIQKKKVMIIADLGRAFIVLITAFLYVNHWLSVPYLFIATFLTSTFESFEIPAGIAIQLKIISADKMISAKLLSTSVATLSQMIGMSIAGTIIFIGMLLNFINVPFSSFQSIYIADYLHLDAQALSLASLFMMFGMFIGSVLAPKINDRLGNYKQLILGGLLGVPFYLCLLFLPNMINNIFLVYFIMCFTIFLFGMDVSIQNVVFGAVFVKNVDENFQSRVGGITNAILSVMMPVGSLLCSVLAILLAVPQIFFIVGILTLVLYLIIANMNIYKTI